MERLTDKIEAYVQRQAYEKRLKNGYPRNIPEERFLKLAAYEDIGLTPEEIKAVINGAVKELSEYDELMPKHSIKELSQADKDGRLVVLLPQANDPLTLTELLKMEGEPVWVMHRDGSGGRWGIVNIYPSGICADVCAGLAYWFEDHIGTIAYRRKPEEETC